MWFYVFFHIPRIPRIPVSICAILNGHVHSPIDMYIISKREREIAKYNPGALFSFVPIKANLRLDGHTLYHQATPGAISFSLFSQCYTIAQKTLSLWGALFSLPSKCIEEPSPFSFRKSNSHSGHERRMQYNCPDLVSSSEIDRRHSSDTLSIENYIFRTDAVACSEGMPCRVYVSVKILLRWFTARYPVARVIVAEYITVYPGTET